MSIDHGKRLYEALNRFTGGIEAFLADRRDQIWSQAGHDDWTMTALGQRRVLFGFFTARNGDILPAPHVSVTLTATGTADLASLVVEDAFGVRHGTRLKPGDFDWLCGLIEECTRRKAAGRLTLRTAG